MSKVDYRNKVSAHTPVDLHVCHI